jgi:putative membrane protein
VECPAEVRLAEAAGSLNACQFYLSGLRAGAGAGSAYGVSVAGKLKALELLPDTLNCVYDNGQPVPPELVPTDLRQVPAGMSCLAVSPLPVVSTPSGDAVCLPISEQISLAEILAGKTGDCSYVPLAMLPKADLDTKAILNTVGAAAYTSAQLATAVQESAKGAAGVAAAAAELKDGGRSFSGGAGELARGATALADGMPKLKSGLDDVVSGSEQTQTGASELSSALRNTFDGSSELGDGVKKLSDSITEGEDSLPVYPTAGRDQLAETAVRPVSDADLVDDVAHYSWATVLLVVALWLGTMAVWMVAPTVSPGAMSASGATWRLLLETLRRPLLAVAGQVVLLWAVAWATFQLPPGRALELLFLLLLEGLTFLLLNHALATWLGNVGRLIAVLFAALTAVLGLTIAQPASFEIARLFSPLTPALSVLRTVVTAAPNGAPSAAALSTWLVLALLSALLATSRSRSTTPESLLSTP